MARASASSTSLPMSVSKIIAAGVCARTAEENTMTRLKIRMAIFTDRFLLVHSKPEGAPSYFAPFAKIGWGVSIFTQPSVYEIREWPQPRVSVASHPCAKNPQGWGTLTGEPDRQFLVFPRHRVISGARLDLVILLGGMDFHFAESAVQSG